MNCKGSYRCNCYYIVYVNHKKCICYILYWGLGGVLFVSHHPIESSFAIQCFFHWEHCVAIGDSHIIIYFIRTFLYHISMYF